MTIREHKTEPCGDCIDAYGSAWEDGLLMGHKDCLTMLFSEARPPPAVDTLKAAQFAVEEGLKDGVTCPCCTQHARMYKRKLNASMSRSLIWIVQVFEDQDAPWIDVPKLAPHWVLKSREYPKLVWWGFIEERTKDPSDSGRRTSGMWRPTAKGVDFARNRISVPSHALIFNRKIEGFSWGKVDITESLGKEFNYQELMGERIGVMAKDLLRDLKRKARETN